nr:MAG TPA: Lysis protein [Caudoviricetes sp.]
MRNTQIVCMLVCGLMLAGCASKEPQIITRTEYQEVKTPIACIKREQLPTPPEYDPSDPQTFKELMEYAVAADGLLKVCAK